MFIRSLLLLALFCATTKAQESDPARTLTKYKNNNRGRGRGRGRGRQRTIKIQELQSPPGPRHSNAIIDAPAGGNKTLGLTTGFVWFSNDLAVPDTGGLNGGTPMGTQTGHCVEVYAGVQLACYFRFALDAREGKGIINAEALFDLTNFPNADLTITGGTGDFMGIIGSGVTSAPANFDGTTFFYTFDYKIVK